MAEISILIVDDDKLVIDKLEEGIQWKDLGIHMVFTAYNIRQAMEVLKEYPVQILLSDIEMPQGSGLELLEWVRSEELPVESIFLSSYAYFAYAQKALSLHSRQYLLKPVSNRELEEILRELIAEIRSREDTKTEACAVASKDGRTGFWNLFLMHEEEHGDDYEACMSAKYADLYEEGNLFCLEIIRIFPDAENISKKERNLSDFIIRTTVGEVFKDSSLRPESIERQSDYEWILVLAVTKEKVSLRDKSICLAACLEEKLHQDVCVYVGNSNDIRNMAGSRTILEDMVALAVPGNCGIVMEEEWENKEIAYQEPPWEVWEKDMMRPDGIRAAKENVLDYIEDLCDKRQITVAVLEQLRKELMQTVYRYLNKQDVSISRIFDGREFDRYYEKAALTLSKMQEFIRYVYDRLSGYGRQDNRQESVVTQIKEYINRHLGEELSRGKLASQVFLSEDYVSRIFVNLTGISIPAYITECRMCKAQEFLKYSSLPVSRIAMEVGYSNFSYFSKSFRDYTGCTPNVYRARMQREHGKEQTPK